MQFMKKYILGLVLLALLIFLAFNKHSKDNYKGYHSVIWADAAGYYVYNPIWFIYGNSTQSFPDSIVAKTGNGFYFDYENNCVKTKYTSGVAILQVPFFLTAHSLAKGFGFAATGFSSIYVSAIMIAGVFYGLLGLLFSFLFLRKYFSFYHSLVTVALFFLATNLYYYMVDASGMLHVYDFFLFSAIALLTSCIYDDFNFKNILLLFLCFYLAVLIRPTNIVLFLFILFFGINNSTVLRNRIQLFKSKIPSIFIAGIFALIIFLPQLFYWIQSYGAPVVYSYGSEGFTNKFSPKFLELWFSTKNGLFSYSPVLLLSIIGIILLIIRKKMEGWIAGVTFLVISYLFASWWIWSFGCSYGSRGFVDFYPVFMYPFAYLISEMKNKIGLILIYAFCALCIWANFDMIYYYDGCFYGGDWDWSSYWKLLSD